ncbi:MAG: Uma2 family endonuclease [Chloroflexota bacterium]
METQPTAIPQNQQTDSQGRGALQSNGLSNGTNSLVSNPYVSPSIPPHLMPDLPTFPLERGWRLVYDEETKTTYSIPLTLRDILFPTEEDVGVVFMTQGPTHNLLIVLITELLRLFHGGRGWYFPNDVLIRWGVPGVLDKGPDIAAIPNTTVPSSDKKSYHVGRDGPLPEAIIEITSESTRDDDFITKRDLYASVGVQEYLIIDIWDDTSAPWQLHGFRLRNSPYYDSLLPDAEGGITLQTLGLRFVPRGRTRVDVYDVTTGERLQDAVTFKTLAETESTRANAEAERANTEANRANTEAERANTEANRADAAEAMIESLQERLQKLEGNQD